MMEEVDCFSAMHTSLHSFMKNGMFTDITFVIGTSKIKAHKAILAACSPVFQTMFDTSMNEAQSDVVELRDVTEELFSAFLDYLYIRDVNTVTQHARGMLMLADKYDIEPLALLCDRLIEASLTPENAVYCSSLAAHYRRDALQTQVNQFIERNLSAVSSTPSWTQLKNNRSAHFNVLTGIIRSAIQEDADPSNKKLDKVTWIANPNWLGGAERWVQLVLRDSEPNIVVHVMPCLDDCNKLIIHVKVENKLNISFKTTLVITLSRNAITASQTKCFQSWAPNSTGEAKFMVVHNQVHSTLYPFKLSVAVKKTEPINHHPYLETVKVWTQRFTDAVCIVENVKFPVHKLVLAGKSMFFSKLFDKNQNEYRIDGMAERTFKALLGYMYSNCNPQPDVVDLPMLKGAEVFQLNDLTNYCIRTLLKKITYDNAIEMCTKAEELKLTKNLTSVIIAFMAKEPKKVLNSPKWPILEKHPRLAEMLMDKIMIQKHTAHSQRIQSSVPGFSPY